MNLVVDASVAVSWFVKEERRDEALAVLRCKARVIVPDLFFAEFANVLWKKRRIGEVTFKSVDLTDWTMSVPGVTARGSPFISRRTLSAKRTRCCQGRVRVQACSLSILCGRT